MNRLRKVGRGRLMAGLVSLLSMTLISITPFESNPQNCGMIHVMNKKKREAYPDDDSMPL